MRTLLKNVVSIASAVVLAAALVPVPAGAEPAPAIQAASAYDVDLSRPCAEGEAVVLYLPVEQSSAARGRNALEAGSAALEADGFSVKQDFDVTVDADIAEENGLGNALGAADVANVLAAEVDAGAAQRPALARSVRAASDGWGSAADTPAETAVRTASENARVAVVTKEGASTAELVAELQQRPDVLVAEPNYQIELETGEGVSEMAETLEAEVARASEDAAAEVLGDGAAALSQASDAFDAQTTPFVTNQKTPDLPYDLTDDPCAPDNLWSLVGVNGIDFPAAYEALAAAKPDPVVVAVIDTGVDYRHPDLAGSMWTNPGTIGLPGAHGYDFACNDDDPLPDLSYHGTHVAGTIAATCNNGTGVVGTSGGAAQIMALKIADDVSEGLTFTDAAVASYQYVLQAKKAGVNVVAISNSWGDWGTSLILEYLIDQLGRAGVMSVFAAGNASSDADESAHLEASNTSPYLLSIAASTSRGDLASFSDYGAANVDVAFPGHEILSTYPTESDKFAAASYLPTLAGTTVIKPGEEREGQGANYFYTSFADATLDQFETQATEGTLRISDGSDLAGYAGTAGLRVEKPEGENVSFSFRIENPFYQAAQVPDDVCFGITGGLVSPSDGVAYLSVTMTGGVAGESLSRFYASRHSFAATPVAIDTNEEVIVVNIQVLGSKSVPGACSVSVGNIGIGCAPDLAAGSYLQASGTSMAAPAASGAYAVLAALYGGAGGESVLDLRGRLLGSTDELPEGQKPVATNGRFTFARALGADPALAPTAYSVRRVGDALQVSGRALAGASVVLDGVDVGSAVSAADSSDRLLELAWDGVERAFAQVGKDVPANATVAYVVQTDGRTFTGRCFLEAPDEGGAAQPGLVQLGALPRRGEATVSGVLLADAENLFLVDALGRYLYRCDDPETGRWTELAAPLDASGTTACSFAYADGKLYRLSNESEPAVPDKYFVYNLRYTLDSYDIAAGTWSDKQVVVEQDGVTLDHDGSKDVTLGAYNGKLVWVRDGSRANPKTDPYVVTFYDPATGEQAEAPLPQETVDRALTLGSRTLLMQVEDKLYLPMYESDTDGDGMTRLHMLAFDGEAWADEAASGFVPEPVASKAPSAAAAAGNGVVLVNEPLDGTGSMTFYRAETRTFEALPCATNTTDMTGSSVCLGSVCYTVASDDEGTGHLHRLPDAVVLASNVYEAQANAGEGGTVRVFAGAAGASAQCASVNVRVGDLVTFTAVPTQGYAFSRWVDASGVAAGTEATLARRATTPLLFSAAFAPVGADPAPNPPSPVDPHAGDEARPLASAGDGSFPLAIAAAASLLALLGLGAALRQRRNG